MADRTKVYVTAVDRILSGIRSGQFAPGSALPSERVLAAELSVSRGSLREALRVLEQAGVLEARPGSGTYVATEGASQALSMRAQAAAIGDHSPLDVIVARASIEPVCAEHAARARTQADITVIRAHLDEQARLTAAGLDASEADNQFHLAIAAASHNSVLASLEHTVISLMHEQTWTDLKSRSRQRSGDQFLEHHRVILQAIEQGDTRRAHQAMLMHISSIEMALIAELDG
ncbi:FadR/GntR family transcriptional regulator [Saccharomonospora sp. NPDC046836]|uniref:FadR/GntR family transcriptional regulator n=1 Tax=Saccharomonospora sp. NPDC046836 TaxID=3156921 RepID=UPI0033FA9D4F